MFIYYRYSDKLGALSVNYLVVTMLIQLHQIYIIVSFEHQVPYSTIQIHIHKYTYTHTHTHTHTIHTHTIQESSDHSQRDSALFQGFSHSSSHISVSSR